MNINNVYKTLVILAMFVIPAIVILTIIPLSFMFFNYMSQAETLVELQSGINTVFFYFVLFIQFLAIGFSIVYFLHMLLIKLSGNSATKEMIKRHNKMKYGLFQIILMAVLSIIGFAIVQLFLMYLK